MISMGREEIKKIQNACTEHRKQAKPNTFWKTSTMLKPPFKNIPAHSLTSLNNKERKALQTHQLNFERKQSEAIRIVRQRIL